MHSTIEANYSWIQAMSALRSELLGALTDADLGFSPGGENGTLGELLVQMGEIQYSYTSSFETFALDWGYTNSAKELTSSLAALGAWFATLDTRLEAVLSALTDGDMQRQIARPGGGSMPIDFQLQVYLQALFIFFGKFVVYLKAMNKPLPPSIRDFIG
jgi:uncharacterized damage-inducible protein DinB